MYIICHYGSAFGYYNLLQRAWVAIQNATLFPSEELANEYAAALGVIGQTIYVEKVGP